MNWRLLFPARPELNGHARHLSNTIDVEDVCRAVRDVLPEAVAFAGGAPYTLDEAASTPPAISLNADKRRREFDAGRFYARSALRALGCEDAPLPVGADRAPVWPDAFVGSISHSATFCGAVAARRQDFATVGFDIEEAGPLDDSLRDSVAAAGEIDAVAHTTAMLEGKAAKLLFIAKEAFFKAYWPITGQFLEFGDVRVRCLPGTNVFEAELGTLAPDLLGERVVRGYHGQTSGLIFAIVLKSANRSDGSA